MSDTLQTGPCVICGGTNYNLSCGGPTICPKCDCGNFDAATVETQAKVIAGLREELRDLQQTFDLQWEADMRAVKLWREAHPGNELVLPDRTNMVVWLLEQHDARAQCAPWQPIETAPQDRTWVLVWEAEINEKYHPAEVARFVNNRWENSAMKYVNAVYWMPIPALTSTYSAPPKAWTEAKAEIDAGWPEG